MITRVRQEEILRHKVQDVEKRDEEVYMKNKFPWHHESRVEWYLLAVLSSWSSKYVLSFCSIAEREGDSWRLSGRRICKSERYVHVALSLSPTGGRALLHMKRLVGEKAEATITLFCLVITMLYFLHEAVDHASAPSFKSKSETNQEPTSTGKDFQPGSWKPWAVISCLSRPFAIHAVI